MGSYPRLGCGRRLVRRFGPEVDVRSLPAWEQILRVLLEALGPVWVGFSGRAGTRAGAAVILD